MRTTLDIAFFGSSLVSAYWNGAATYYRGLLKALADRGHRITFFEPDAYERQRHRDMPDPPWARVVVYAPGADGLESSLEAARKADLVVKASGVGVLDRELEEAVPVLRSNRTQVAFWDVDAPATLGRLRQDPYDPFRRQISTYDFVFTYGGGDAVVRAYRLFGARVCVPIYNALDPSTHFPVSPDPRFEADLAFLGNRLPDREARVQEFFFHPARRLGQRRFLLAGSGWELGDGPSNVRVLGHLYTREHNAFNSTPRAVLNVCRSSMAEIGFSPATRLFEAAGAGACILTDSWEGVEAFLEPDREILVARDGEEVVERLRELTPDRARAIGRAARAKVLREHTYEQRAAQVEAVLGVESARAAS